ncbi:MAG: S41 family peptidase [Candidatus Limnocylindrales bacterium]
MLVLLLVAFIAGIAIDRTGLGGGGTAEVTAPTQPGSTAGGTIGPGVTVPPDMPANFGLFWEAVDLVRQHYVDQSKVTDDAITYGSISGMIDALGDPGHTIFLTPADLKSEQDELSGTIVGIGVYLAEPSGSGGALIIQSVIPGSPAEAAGLRARDQIIAVDGTNVENMDVAAVATMIRGPAGTKVTLTVIHADGDSPVDITITREVVTVPAVSWHMVPGTSDALVAITQFSDKSSQQLKAAVQAAQAAGAKGIVLDLREDPGGLVNEAVGTASQFLASGDVYIRQTSDGTQIKVPVQSGGIATSIPLVVLVDYGTASSAEIVAGALQDPARAKIVGVRTFGTGTVLNTFPLSDGSAVRLAVEEWLTPLGRHIFPNGITPDVQVNQPSGVVDVTPDALAGMTAAQVVASGDTQLLAGLKQLGATP